MAYRVAYSNNNMKHIPNLLSLLRMLLVGVVLALFLLPYEKPQDWIWFDVRISPILFTISMIFMFASLTDWLDGFLARRYHLESTLGKLIDPLADKLMVNITGLALVITYAWLPDVHLTMPLWVIALWLMRDFTVDGVRLIAASQSIIIPAHPIGKAKTVIQILAILSLLWNDLLFATFGLPTGWTITEMLLYLATAISLISGYYYVISHRHLFKG